MPLASLIPLGIITAALGVSGTLLWAIPYLTRGEVRRARFFLLCPLCCTPCPASAAHVGARARRAHRGATALHACWHATAAHFSARHAQSGAVPERARLTPSLPKCPLSPPVASIALPPSHSPPPAARSASGTSQRGGKRPCGIGTRRSRSNSTGDVRPWRALPGGETLPEARHRHRDGCASLGPDGARALAARAAWRVGRCGAVRSCLRTATVVCAV